MPTGKNVGDIHGDIQKNTSFEYYFSPPKQRQARVSCIISRKILTNSGALSI